MSESQGKSLRSTICFDKRLKYRIKEFDELLRKLKDASPAGLEVNSMYHFQKSKVLDMIMDELRTEDIEKSLQLASHSMTIHKNRALQEMELKHREMLKKLEDVSQKGE